MNQRSCTGCSKSLCALVDYSTIIRFTDFLITLYILNSVCFCSTPVSSIASVSTRKHKKNTNTTQIYDQKRGSKISNYSNERSFFNARSTSLPVSRTIWPFRLSCFWLQWPSLMSALHSSKSTFIKKKYNEKTSYNLYSFSKRPVWRSQFQASLPVASQLVISAVT
jgi:hypothetical protein